MKINEVNIIVVVISGGDGSNRKITSPVHYAKSYRPFELFVNENYKL